MLARFSLSFVDGLLRQHKQQKQNILVHVLGVSFGFGSCDSIESLRLRQHLKQQQSVIRLQHGLQHLKQLRRLQQLSFSSFFIDAFSFNIIFFC
jgi:hypothetical protein